MINRQYDLVSIVMPMFNVEEFIGAAIESVINQTYENWELLVIDDASPDSSYDVAIEYEKIDNRIKVLSNVRNQGVSFTRNRGMELAKGTWIAFFDSDDCWTPEKLEAQLLTAMNKSASFIYTGCSFIDSHGTEYGIPFVVPEEITLYTLRRWNSIICSSVLLKRDTIGMLRFEHDETREDYLFWLKAIKICKVAYGVNKPLIKYRVLANSRSSCKVAMIFSTYLTHRALGSGRVLSSIYTLFHFVNSGSSTLFRTVC